MIGHFPNETSALVMVFSILEGESKVAARALEQEPISLEFLEKALIA